MKRISPIVLGLSLAVAGSLLSAAQEMSSQASIPKVLQITREFIKPGKSGMVHDRSESNFVQAMARAKARPRRDASPNAESAHRQDLQGGRAHG